MTNLNRVRGPGMFYTSLSYCYYQLHIGRLLALNHLRTGIIARNVYRHGVRGSFLP